MKKKIRVQQKIIDLNKDFWFKVEDGKFHYGESIIENANFTFTCNLETGARILFGNIEIIRAFMEGDIKMHGKYLKTQRILNKLLRHQEKLLWSR